MKRAFWFAAGAASGVYGMVKARRALETFTPDGVGARVAAAKRGVRMFADEVGAGMNEREADLLAELKAASAEHRELEAAPDAAPAPVSPQITKEGSTDGHR